MRYLFIFRIGDKQSICCCRLKCGLITVGILSFIFSLINFAFPSGKYNKIFDSMGCIPPILMIVTSFSIRHNLAKVATIIHTIYLYLFLLIVLVMTIYMAVEGYLNSYLYIAMIVDRWLYIIWLFFTIYVFTCFCCNYEQAMGIKPDAHSVFISGPSNNQHLNENSQNNKMHDKSLENTV
jgi:hypothetical protein